MIPNHGPALDFGLGETADAIRDTTARFAADRIAPIAADIDRENAFPRSLWPQMGDLGLHGITVEEEFGGLGMDKITSAIVSDHISVVASFSTAFSGQIGIATLPVVWYGTDEQKRRYLPKLATGEWFGTYALSEASSGSDAMNIRTRAVLSPDGSHYILNGEKMWITNGGFADLYLHSGG